MKRTELGHLLEKALLIVISLLLIFIGVVLILRPLLIPDNLESSPAKTGGTGSITADDFTTVFTLAENAALVAKTYQEHLLRSIVPLALGIIGLLYAGALLIYCLIFNLKSKRTPYSIATVAIIAMCGGIMGLNLLNRTDAQHISECADLQHTYDSQEYRLTEGIVHVSNVESASGHGSGDLIRVGDALFEVSYFVSTCAYKQTIAYGGVLTEGTYAKIYYTDDHTILRIDVKNQ